MWTASFDPSARNAVVMPVPAPPIDFVVYAAVGFYDDGETAYPQWLVDGGGVEVTSSFGVGED